MTFKYNKYKVALAHLDNGYGNGMPEEVLKTIKELLNEKINNKEIIKKDIEIPEEVSKEVFNEWVKLRKQKKAPVTNGVLKRLRKRAEQINWTLEQVMEKMIDRGWSGFEPSWLEREENFRRRGGIPL